MIAEKIFIGLMTLAAPALVSPYMNNAGAKNQGDTETMGFYTKVSLSIDGGNGQVCATAKNEFTLFPSRVQVYVEIYYSKERTSDYTQMTLAQRNYIEDLDQGKSIQAVGSTHGETLYWMGRVEFKADNKDWKYGVTDARLFDGNGNLVI